MSAFALPTGAVVPYAGLLADSDAAANNNTDRSKPTNLEEIRSNLAAAGWLYCDGKSYPCKQYQHLYGVIGNAFGGDSTNFNVPDLRGRFIRGVDGGAGLDPQAAGRSAQTAGGNSGDLVGSIQGDAFQGHQHNYTMLQTAPATGGPAAQTLYNLPLAPAPVTTNYVADGNDGKPRTASETRPVNLYLNFIIRT